MANAEVSKRIKESKSAGGITLDLSGIGVTDQDVLRLTKALPQLVNLNLDGCAELTKIGLDALKSLKKLKELSLRYKPVHQSDKHTEVGTKADGYKKDSQVSGWPALAALRGLEKLDLYGRKEISDDVLQQIGRITSLRWLSLSACKFTERGLLSLTGLQKLESLDLSFCYITDSCISALTDLKKLEFLDLHGAPEITNECFKYFEKMISLKRLKLHHLNAYSEGVALPVQLSIASELLRTEDVQEILKAWRSGLAFLEARIAFVGMAGVGKSWLFRRCFLDEVVSKDEPRSVTEDIGLIQDNKLKWKPTISTDDGERLITPHIWDFGGQLIKHGVHEPFFTSEDRTLFVLVLSAKKVLQRKCDANGHECGNGLDYWLKSLAHFAGKDAPILIVLTQCDRVGADEKREVDAISGRSPKKFRQDTGANVIAPVVDGMSACQLEPESIIPLRTAIEKALNHLPGIRSKMSTDLWRLNEVVSRSLQDNLSVSTDEYTKLCDKCGITERRAQDTYLRVMHQLGTLFFFGLTETEDANLSDDSHDTLPPGQRRFRTAKRDTILGSYFLNPRWWKTVVYKVVEQSSKQAWWTKKDLDDFISAVQHDFTAIFRRRDESLLQAFGGSIEEMKRWRRKPMGALDPKQDHALIRASLELSELCFFDEQRGKYLFPRGLPDEKLVTTDSWLRATATFSFFPEAAFHRLLVKLHARGKVLKNNGRPMHHRWSVIATEQGNESVRVAVVADPENGTLELRMDPSSDETSRLVLARQLYDIFNGECMGRTGPTTDVVFKAIRNQPNAEKSAHPSHEEKPNFLAHDNSWARWNGVELYFTPTGGDIVRILWDANKENRRVYIAEILQKLGRTELDNREFRVRDYFENCETCREWEKMIRIKGRQYYLA